MKETSFKKTVRRILTTSSIFLFIIFAVFPVNAQEITPPGKPGFLSPTAGENEISITWAHPASNGGSVITDWEIKIDTSVYMCDAYGILEKDPNFKSKIQYPVSEVLSKSGLYLPSYPDLVNDDIVFVDDDEGYLNPNQAKSPMSIEKMNEINAKAKEFNFTYITKPKISGACLVLSSDLIKCGVNVPPCLLYNDDEGLSIMSERILGQTFVQFVCDNVLHIHARRHPNKRL